MHLLAISLLSILAGTLLLAKFKKEMPGKFFSFISWFFIVVGFILFIGFVAGGICKLAHHCSACKASCQQEMMMKNCNPGMHGGFGRPQGMHKGGFCAPHDMNKGIPCCPEEMGKGAPCCPEEMGKAGCPEKAECGGRSMMMKGCPKHAQGDSAKLPASKK
jgi:hypothetical protein